MTKKVCRLTITLSPSERRALRLLAANLDKECGPLIREWINAKLQEMSNCEQNDDLQQVQRREATL